MNRVARVLRHLLPTSGYSSNTAFNSRQCSSTSFGSGEVQRIQTSHGGIAYCANDGNDSYPSVIFSHGWQSNMLGTKALAIHKYCQKNNIPYIRFDYSACGQSEGDLLNITLTDWKKDLLFIIDRLTAGPCIIVGSSIGAWLMILAALERPHRIHSLIGLAAAADFPQRFWAKAPQEVQRALQRDGVAHLDTEYGDYLVTKQFLDDALRPENSILTRPGGMAVNCPVRLYHGMKDSSVPYKASLDLAQALHSLDVEVILKKDGDHRLSQPGDIQMMFQLLDELIFGRDRTKELALSSYEASTVKAHPEHMINTVHKFQRLRQNLREVDRQDS